MNKLDLAKEKSKRKRYFMDSFWKTLFKLATIFSASLIIIVIIFVTMKGIQPFLPNYANGTQSIVEFLTGMVWRGDQGVYGIGFIIINTIVSAFFALLIAFPMAILSALFIVKIAPKRLAGIMQTVVELLASIPSVVFGLFAADAISGLVMKVGSIFGFATAGGSSLLTVIILLAIMIYPTITSMSITAIKAVPKDLEQASLALGASDTQTNFKVVLRSAKSGIFAGAILGLGRAFGEATAVSMVAGNKAFGPSINPFDITRTLTSTMLSGLKETTGLDYDIRFSVGIVLILLILISNALLNYFKKRIAK